MPSEGSDGIGFGIGTVKGLPVWQSASRNRIGKFAVLIWWINKNQDKATKPQTVQIVRQGEATLYWFKFNPL
ncbi:hypothetical protein KEM39_03810 [Neisseria sp. Marseille-Q1983]|uniref:hypothetical protein n=1 Tax=Neisseria sp. Marseille-Q1983 TaxID=2830768 RepID=UPI001BA8E3B1|nr:hypothetical protein [Neisseria sp. Marseille-Q1983]